MLSTCPSVCACSGGGSFTDRFAVDFSFICCDEYLLIFLKLILNCGINVKQQCSLTKLPANNRR